ncbi:MAG: aspartate aminotransferase [Thermoanaerobacteraceae bacterium]|jgi:aspartate aminotransferase|nr:aspartate aminotransferase [Thermoanaerobacteraceae bacterium]MDN5301985.1 aspartate aminotransferase [Thermoanaerobacteraceae bacterium]MDN5311529.1 aspartate aminotransferase [Thermoanaerobacteraceae bacterium]RKL64137.1 pyridoxal phosphate-dependent aminotransferase [Thermoanaerobacteraceae bacterium SP2]
MNLSEKAKGISPSPTLAVDTKAKQMKKEGQDVIGFGAGEPDFDTPDYIKTAAISAVNQGFTKYTPVGGILELKDAISKYLEESTGTSYKQSQIIVSNGAKQCLFNALYCLINPGEKVLIPSPYWVSYPELVKLCGGEPVFVNTKEEDDFQLKVEALKPLIDDKTKVLIINSPNNPTGSVYSKEDLKEIAKIAAERDIFIISDEIYDKLIYDGEKHTSIVAVDEAMKNRTVVINGMSKTFAMTGWRIGFAAGPDKLIEAMTDLQSHSTSNPNSIAQKASLEALTNSTKQDTVARMVKEFSARRTYMVDRINEIPYLSCRLPKGAFYVMMNISATFGKQLDGIYIKDSSSFAEILLEKYKVAVVPGVAFGTEDYVRLSYATSMENIKKGLDRIEEFVKALR